MNSIIKAGEADATILSQIGKISFIESHGHSASVADINSYLTEKYSPEAFSAELKAPENIYHIIYHKQQAAGYSNLILNSEHTNVPGKNVSKLDRLYLLKEFYDLKLGLELYQFNVDLSKKNGQSGMWLFAWKENHRAIYFYKKAGFEIVGSHNFNLTKTHSNPNHQLLLKY